MPSKSPASSFAVTTDPSLASVLEALSLALLGLFVAAVVVSAWPAKILDPQWQLGLTADLIYNGSLALVGALLTPWPLLSNQAAIAYGLAATPSVAGPWPLRSASCC